MSKHRCDKHNIWEKIKNLKVKRLCAKDAKIKKIETEKILVNGADVECLLGRPGVTVKPRTYDCMDCEGNPIKPDNIDQDVWDFLKCNREAYQTQLQQEFLDGRNNIRCIRQAYSCPPQCPDDCSIPSTCLPIFEGSISGTTLTVTSIQAGTGQLVVGSTIESIPPEPPVATGTVITALGTGTGGVGTYEINIEQEIPPGTTMNAIIPCPSLQPGETGPCPPFPPECIAPNPETCDLTVPNLLYKTMTVPFVFRQENPCGGENFNGFPFAGSRFITNMGYNLDINNVTCNLATRVATVMVHYAYKGSTGPTGPTGPSCPECPNVVDPEGLICLCETPPSDDINCGIIRVNCKQFYFTININLGENFSNTVNIPSEIVQAMIDATPLPFDPTNIIGAFQLVVFIEDGLDVASNEGMRGGGGNDSGTPTTQDTGCFNGEAKILMGDGSMKRANEIEIGDSVSTVTGQTTIEGRIMQKCEDKKLVKINDLIISNPHRIMYENRWIKPIDYPGSEYVNTNIPVYNFVTENRQPLIVEGIIASTLGMYCPGSHDLSKPVHQLWASDHIVNIFKSHPQWPNVEVDSNILNVLKTPDFVKEYIDSITEEINIEKEPIKIAVN